MFRLLALTPLLLASILSQVGAASALSTTQPTSSIATSGVTLTLTFERQSYPLNALAQATVILTNRSGHAITTWDCVPASLGAMVIAPQGFTLYPPLLRPPGAPWSECQGAIAGPRFTNLLHIAPSQSVTRKTYVVLRAFTVRAWADLRLQSSQGKPVTVLTPPIHLGTSGAPGPRLTIHRTRTATAVVTPVPGGGPVLYSQFAYCRDGREHPEVAGATVSRWTPTSQLTLHPFEKPCASLAEWSLFVGQPGRPIEHVYYCARHDFCAYAPPTPQEMAVAACKTDIARAVLGGKLPRNAARYAIGLASTPPSDLTPQQKQLADAFHTRCTAALKLNKTKP